MRTIITISLAATVALFAAAAVAQDHPDIEAAIDALSAKYEEGWAAADASICAATYTDDAESMDAAGQIMRGKAAIEERIAANIEQYGSSTLEIRRTSLHVVKPGLVVADGEWEVKGSSAERPMSGFYTLNATNSSGEWLGTSDQVKIAPAMPE